MALICVGNSHLVTLSKGAAEVGTKLIEFRLREIKRSKTEGWFDREVRQGLAAVISAERADHIFCFIGGGAPAVVGLMQHPRPFDFILPDRPDLAIDGGAEVIPYEAMYAVMEKMVRKHFKMLRRLLQLRTKLIQVETPPPIADSGYLRDLASRHNREINIYGVSSPRLRYKIWFLHSRVFEEFCTKRNIIYIKNPANIFDDNGFLDHKYWGDFVHGNKHYGVALLRHLEAFK